MAGRVVVSTLNNDTGVLATQNGMTGIAKAYVNYDGTGTPSIRSSFNVSSITRNGTGLYTVNFTTAMPNVNYSVVANAIRNAAYPSVCGSYQGNRTTTSCLMNTTESLSSWGPDPNVVDVVVFSS